MQLVDRKPAFLVLLGVLGSFHLSGMVCRLVDSTYDRFTQEDGVAAVFGRALYRSVRLEEPLPVVSKQVEIADGPLSEKYTYHWS